MPFLLTKPKSYQVEAYSLTKKSVNFLIKNGAKEETSQMSVIYRNIYFMGLSRVVTAEVTVNLACFDKREQGDKILLKFGSHEEAIEFTTSYYESVNDRW